MGRASPRSAPGGVVELVVLAFRVQSGQERAARALIGRSGLRPAPARQPVFANIGHARSLKRFSLRSAAKVNTQWLLYCLVHNIGKLQRYGTGAKRSTVKNETRH